jgi:hypothetical protein
MLANSTSVPLETYKVVMIKDVNLKISMNLDSKIIYLLTTHPHFNFRARHESIDEWRVSKIRHQVTEMEKKSGNTVLLRGRVKASFGRKSPSKRQYGHESFH